MQLPLRMEVLRVVHKIGSTTTTTDYCGNVVYENGTPKYLLTEEGYVTLTDKKYHYFLKDHQGNNRVVVDAAGTVEEVNHYYPFGGTFASTSVQPYKYNGKEYDDKKELNWYDYGARHYDAATGRFTAIDPMTEKYFEISPYTYCVNNPIKFVDPNGKKIVIGTFWQRIGAALGFDNFVTKVSQQIQQNRMDSRRLDAVYDQLEKSELVFRILPLSESPYGTERGNHVVPNSAVARGKKQGATMYYDPDMDIAPISGEQRIARIGLAHETGHFEDFMYGKVIPVHDKQYRQGDKVEIYKKELNERTSMELENIIRNIYGYEKRKEYFIKDNTDF